MFRQLPKLDRDRTKIPRKTGRTSSQSLAKKKFHEAMRRIAIGTSLFLSLSHMRACVIILLYEGAALFKNMRICRCEEVEEEVREAQKISAC